MNKNTVLAWATFIMIFVGVGMIALGAFKYDEVAGYGFGAVGIYVDRRVNRASFRTNIGFDPTICGWSAAT